MSYKGFINLMQPLHFLFAGSNIVSQPDTALVRLVTPSATNPITVE